MVTRLMFSNQDRSRLKWGAHIEMWERVGGGECSTFQQCSRLQPDNTGPVPTVLPNTTINMLQCLTLGHCRSAPQQHGKGLLLAVEVFLPSSI